MKSLVEMGMTLSGAPEDEEKWQEAARALWTSFADEIGGADWVAEAGRLIADATANISK